MYFVLSSTLTVGYGDVEPRGLVAKILTIVYFPIGTCIDTSWFKQGVTKGLALKALYKWV